MVLKRATQSENMDRLFCFLRAQTASTGRATGEHHLPDRCHRDGGLNNIDIGGASPVGSGAYTGGI